MVRGFILPDMIDNLWFPYFSLQDGILPLKVKLAKGSRLIVEDGVELVDAVASWWSICHGYLHPFIIEKMETQLKRLPHVMFGGITHDAAEELSYKLVKFLEPKELSRVFFCDSGSVAVEVALKMCLQYFFEIGKQEKNKIIYFENGYHGETFGALSVSHSMQSRFPSIQNGVCLKIPTTEEEFAKFENIISLQARDTACAIIEPILQGAGGMIITEPENILRLWQILKKHDILIIADECATGFYRTGEKFAFKKVGMEPDVLVLGKALTAGYIPFAATVAKEYIFEGICKRGRFLHGPTFMANPLAASAASASIELFEREDYIKKVKNIELYFKDFFKNYQPNIIGAMCSFKITKEQNIQIKKDVSHLKTKSFLRPFGDTLYCTPPLNITNEDLNLILNDIKKYL